MRQIRIGTFETNSSSTHSLTIVSEEDFEKWKVGELIFQKYEDKLVPVLEGNEEDGEFFTHDRWLDSDLETFTQRFTTKSGDKIVAFGEFGREG